jgi:dihydrofolate reductase
MVRPIVMVVAVARNGVIGRDNGLPWHMRSDLKHFKQATMGKPLIMGRKTYESIGRPLPGRDTVIVTRDPSFRPDGTHQASSLGRAIELADALAEARGADEIVIAGGGSIYAEAMPRAQRLVVTIVDLAPEGDARFPAIDEAQWREVSRVAHPRGEGDDARFDIVTYERR